MPHATARVRHVAQVPRDDVHVQMHDRLARRSARVEADVVAIGAGVASVELGLDPLDEAHDGVSLGLGCIPPGGDFALGDDEAVAGRDREGVFDSER